MFAKKTKQPISSILKRRAERIGKKHRGMQNTFHKQPHHRLFLLQCRGQELLEVCREVFVDLLLGLRDGVLQRRNDGGALGGVGARAGVGLSTNTCTLLHNGSIGVGSNESEGF